MVFYGFLLQSIGSGGGVCYGDSDDSSCCLGSLETNCYDEVCENCNSSTGEITPISCMHPTHGGCLPCGVSGFVGCSGSCVCEPGFGCICEGAVPGQHDQALCYDL